MKDPEAIYQARAQQENHTFEVFLSFYSLIIMLLYCLFIQSNFYNQRLLNYQQRNAVNKHRDSASNEGQIFPKRIITAIQRTERLSVLSCFEGSRSQSQTFSIGVPPQERIALHRYGCERHAWRGISANQSSLVTDTFIC